MAALAQEYVLLCYVHLLVAKYMQYIDVYIPQDFLILVFSSRYSQAYSKMFSSFLPENTKKKKRTLGESWGMFDSLHLEVKESWIICM